MKSYKSGSSENGVYINSSPRRWTHKVGKLLMPLMLTGSLIMSPSKSLSKDISSVSQKEDLSHKADRLLNKTHSIDVYVHTLNQFEKSIDALRKSRSVKPYSNEIFSVFGSLDGFKLLEKIADKYGGYTPDAKSEIESSLILPIKRKVLLGSLSEIGERLVKSLDKEHKVSEARYVRNVLDDYVKGRIPLRNLNELVKFLVGLKLEGSPRVLRDLFISNYNTAKLLQRSRAWDVAGGLLLNLCRRYVEYYLHNKSGQSILSEYDKVADQLDREALDIESAAKNKPNTEAKRLRRNAQKLRRKAKQLRKVSVKVKRKLNITLKRLAKTVSPDRKSARKIYKELKERHVKAKSEGSSASKSIPHVKDLEGLSKLNRMINESVDRSVARLEVLKSVTINSNVKFEPHLGVLIHRLNLISSKVDQSYRALKSIYAKLPPEERDRLIRRVKRGYMYIYYRLIWFERKVGSIYNSYSQGQSLNKIREKVKTLSNNPLKKPHKTKPTTSPEREVVNSSSESSLTRPSSTEKKVAPKGVAPVKPSERDRVEGSNTSSGSSHEGKVQTSIKEDNSTADRTESKDEIIVVEVRKKPSSERRSKKAVRVEFGPENDKESEVKEDLERDKESNVKLGNLNSYQKADELSSKKEVSSNDSEQDLTSKEDEDYSQEMVVLPIKTGKGFTGLLGSSDGIMGSDSRIGVGDLYVAEISDNSTFGLMFGVSSSGLNNSWSPENRELISQWYYLAPMFGVLGRLGDNSYMGIAGGYATDGHLPVFPAQLILLSPKVLFEGNLVYSVLKDWVKSPTFNGRLYYEGENTRLYLSGQHIPAPSYYTGNVYGWMDSKLTGDIGLSAQLMYNYYSMNYDSLNSEFMASIGLFGEINNTLRIAPMIGLDYSDHDYEFLYGGSIAVNFGDLRLRLAVMLDNNSKIKYVIPSVVIKGE